MTRIIILYLLMILLTACGQGDMIVPETAMKEFELFKSKEKFVEDMSIFYPGIAEPELAPILTEKINQAADDFEEIASSETPNGSDYLKAMECGLNRFIGTDLDTEDREMVATYFQELMDIVGLESSDGKLNGFVYGFNPE